MAMEDAERSMSASRSKRGRSYVSKRYPEGYVTWVDLDEDDNPIFRGESNPYHARDMRMIARRRLI